MKTMSFDAFLSDFAKPMAQIADQLFKPLYRFNLGPLEGLFSRFSRKMLGIQKHAAAALCLKLKHSRAAFLVGEMGSGKSTVATACGIALAAEQKIRRVLVLCPSHLLEKWKREVALVDPLIQVHIITSIADLESAVESDMGSDNVSFYILSKETAKLGYDWTPAFAEAYSYATFEGSNGLKILDHKVKCSIVCPNCFSRPRNREGNLLNVSDLSDGKCFCDICGSALWTARRLGGGSGKPRFPIARYISKKLKGYFGLFIADECHQFKNHLSAQGEAMGVLAESCRKTLLLTGTLFGGRSSSIFHLLYKTDPLIRKEYSYDGVSEFIERYGIVERIYDVREDNNEDGSSRTVRTVDDSRERPGCSPELISHILNKAVFVRLSDLSEELPPFREHPIALPMTPEQASSYSEFESSILTNLKRAPFHSRRRVLSSYLQSLLTYPDQPFALHRVYFPDSEEVLASSQILESDRLYPKEEKLLEICSKNRAAGRRVVVFCSHTEVRDVTVRLSRILTSRGFKVAVIKSDDVSARQREAHIDQLTRDGAEVLILHARLVEVGLDLLAYPTAVFYEVEVSPYTVRQSSRRSWRLGQTLPVDVYYFCYKGTIQEKALILVSELVRASVSFDGEVFDLKSLAGFNLKTDNVVNALADRILSSSSFTDLDRVFSTVRQKDGPLSDGFIGGFHMPVPSNDVPLDRSILPSQEFDTTQLRFQPEVFKSGATQLSLF